MLSVVDYLFVSNNYLISHTCLADVTKHLHTKPVCQACRRSIQAIVPGLHTPVGQQYSTIDHSFVHSFHHDNLSSNCMSAVLSGWPWEWAQWCR